MDKIISSLERIRKTTKKQLATHKGHCIDHSTGTHIHCVFKAPHVSSNIVRRQGMDAFDSMEMEIPGIFARCDEANV